jgi:hypothetical protein
VPSLEDTVRHTENQVVHIFSPIVPEDSFASGLSFNSKIRTAYSFVVRFVACLITHGVSTGSASLDIQSLLNSKDGRRTQGCLVHELDPARVSADSW